MSKTKQIQDNVYQYAINRNFTAPYGVLTGEHRNKLGHKYHTVIFGYARTCDIEVRIYGDAFILLRDSRSGNTVFKSETDLINFLNTL